MCGGTFVILQQLDDPLFRGPGAADAVRALQEDFDTVLIEKLIEAGVDSDHAFFRRITLAAGLDGRRGRVNAHLAAQDGISRQQLAALLRATVLFMHADGKLSFYSRHAATFFGRRQVIRPVPHVHVGGENAIDMTVHPFVIAKVRAALSCNGEKDCWHLSPPPLQRTTAKVALVSTNTSTVEQIAEVVKAPNGALAVGDSESDHP